MRAVEVVEVGRVAYREVPEPQPGPGEVLVAVRVAGLNRRDLYVRAGQLGVRPPYRMFSDGAGRVVAVGPGVDPAVVGTEVIVNPSVGCGRCAACLSGDEPACTSFRIFDGAGADLVALPWGNVVPRPEGMTDEEAAVLGLVTATAYSMVFQLAAVRPGERVLVWGAQGGLGSLAVQLGRLAGAEVVAVGSDAAYLEGLGAERVLDRHAPDFVETLRRHGPFDVVLDSVGRDTFPLSLEVLRRGGRLVLVGATSGAEVTLDLPQVFRRRVAVLGAFMGPRAALARMAPLFGRGVLRAPAVTVYPASRAEEALAALAAGGVRGKIAVRLGA